MADLENMQEVPIEKNSKIVVDVDESLPDILVVTFKHGSKIFQGVLLDSTKRHLPFGVNHLHPAYSKDSNEKLEVDDRLYSANQRFTYQEGAQPPPKEFSQKRSVRLPTRYKNAKLTVRLRPRQVLCSKCRGICNENSENVDASKKRKSADDEVPRQNKRGCAIATRASRPLSSDSQSNELQSQQQTTRMCLRLMPLPVKDASPSSLEEMEEPASAGEDFEERIPLQNEFKTEFKGFKQPSPTKGKGKKMVLRKKRSVGSMEDLWDESVFEEQAGALSAQGVDLSHSTRTIKISFGREGEGTVLKIPAKIEDLESPDAETQESATEKQLRNKDASAKAARRALKKAKKEARRKILLGSGGSPCYALGSGSPRYALAGNGSPRYSITSPRHGLGSHSPRYAVAATSSSYENFVPRRHKHKLKHKKKHREDRRAPKDPLAITPADAAEPTATEEAVTEMKERCLKQKLSINLKRLNASAYTRCDSNNSEPENGFSIAPTEEPFPKPCEVESSEHSDEQSENVPDFPSVPAPLMIHVTAQNIDSAVGADGRPLVVGDVVWGKIHGFPWWPGKVLTITDGGGKGLFAHVAWYGSNTSSLMPCDQLSPFLENFKIRYNKKKRGPYKEAIKQATTEARMEAPLSPPPLPPPEVVPPPALVQPALASPREIDVVS